MSEEGVNRLFSFEDLSPEKLEDLVQKSEKLDLDLIRYRAIILNKKDTLEWLHKQGHKFTDAAAQECMKNRRLNLLQYIRSTGWEWSDNIIEYAVHDLDILKWMIENNCPHDKKSLISASIIYLFGHIQTLKYLHEELHYPILEEHLMVAEKLERIACAEYIKSVLDKRAINN